METELLPHGLVVFDEENAPPRGGCDGQGC